MNPARDQSTPLKISTIVNPVFKVELPSGVIESYDPLELIEKITAAASAPADKPYPGAMLPPDALGAAPPPEGTEPRQPQTFHEILLSEFHLKESDFPGLSARNVMLQLWAEINMYVEGLEVTKKLSGLVQRNSSSAQK